MNNWKGKGKKLLIYTNSLRHVTNVSRESRKVFKICSKEKTNKQTKTKREKNATSDYN